LLQGESKVVLIVGTGNYLAHCMSEAHQYSWHSPIQDEWVGRGHVSNCGM